MRAHKVTLLAELQRYNLMHFGSCERLRKAEEATLRNWDTMSGLQSCVIPEQGLWYRFAYFAGSEGVCEVSGLWKIACEWRGEGGKSDVEQSRESAAWAASPLTRG